MRAGAERDRTPLSLHDRPSGDVTSFLEDKDAPLVMATTSIIVDSAYFEIESLGRGTVLGPAIDERFDCPGGKSRAILLALDCADEAVSAVLI